MGKSVLEQEMIYRAGLLHDVGKIRIPIDIINKPDIIALISRKASAKLGRPVRVVVTDDSGFSAKSEQLEELVNFGRSHSDIVTFTDNNE